MSTERKLPGKTEFSGRRRSVTRRSGFHTHPDTTGGELRWQPTPSIQLKAGETLRVRFEVKPKIGKFVGFGMWFLAPKATNVSVRISDETRKYMMTPAAAPDWSKFGSMWISNGEPVWSEIQFQMVRNGVISIWEPGCGVIEHPRLASARKELLGNMHQFSPEAHFYSSQGLVQMTVDGKQLVVTDHSQRLPLKSCNRCGRFLPVNFSDEQLHLSFSNHCTAVHRRPCKHGAFGRLRDVDSEEVRHLEFGFQLECRFCKKFEVNAAHNPQRTSAQMKEDAARRRAFELLLHELYGGSPSLTYRARTGRELADDVWETFEHACFNCGRSESSFKNLAIDHTRPLALLWPLDETATALCGNCNSSKRDRYPSDFYSKPQLRKLSDITGIPLHDLEAPSPNLEAVALLRKRIDWFFEEFLTKPELTKIRDGKTAAELTVKALAKVLARCPKPLWFDIEKEFENRRQA